MRNTGVILAVFDPTSAGAVELIVHSLDTPTTASHKGQQEALAKHDQALPLDSSFVHKPKALSVAKLAKVRLNVIWAPIPVPSLKTIESLFHPEPQQWGLRGDPFLWRKMAEAFHDVPLPASTPELTLEIERMFETLTGQPITASEFIWLKQFAHGGMSSGGIAPEFWRETALPLLLSRFAS